MTTLDVTAKGIEPEEDAVFVPRRYQALRYFMRSRAAMFGGAIVTVLVICAIFAPWLAPHDPSVQNLNMATLPPFWLHGAQPGYWLGTDELDATSSRASFTARASRRSLPSASS